MNDKEEEIKKAIIYPKTIKKLLSNFINGNDGEMIISRVPTSAFIYPLKAVIYKGTLVIEVLRQVQPHKSAWVNIDMACFTSSEEIIKGIVIEDGKLYYKGIGGKG